MARIDGIMTGARAFVSGTLGTLSNPEGLSDAFYGGAPTTTGKNINGDNALTVPAFWAGVRLLAETTRILPLEVFTPSTNGVTTRQPTNRMWQILHDQPNSEMSAPELWELVTAWLNIRGNAYVYKERNQFGQVVALWPIDPRRVIVGRKGGVKVYLVYAHGAVPDAAGMDGVVGMGTDYDIIHFRSFGTNGLVGLSPVTYHRETLGLASAEAEVQGRFLANNARPSGVLSTDGTLTPEAAKRMDTRWRRAHAGLQNAAKVAVLEGGVRWQQTSLSMADAQFLEQHKFTAGTIAQILRVPASKIDAEAGTNPLTYQNTEQEGISYLTYSVLPQLSRIEEPINMDPDLNVVPGQKVLFDVRRLLRVQELERFRSYWFGIASGWLSPAEVRAMENREPGPASLNEFRALAMVKDPPLRSLDPGADAGPDVGDPAERRDRMLAAMAASETLN